MTYIISYQNIVLTYLKKRQKKNDILYYITPFLYN